MTEKSAFVISVLLSTLVAGAGCSHSPKWKGSQDHETSDVRIARLGAESQKAKSACEEFEKKVEAILVAAGPKGADGEYAPLSSKEQVRDLLSVAESYPGTPQAQKEAAGEFLWATSNGVQVDLAKFGGAYPCTPMAYLSAANALIQAGDELKLPRAERERIRKLILAKAALDLKDAASLLSILIHSAMVREIVDRGYAKVSDALYVAFLDARVDVLNLRREIQQMHFQNQDHSQVLWVELRGARDIGYRYGELLKRIE